MASVIHIDCESCGGKCIVKIPTEFQDDYKCEVCPLCGAAAETHDDLDDE